MILTDPDQISGIFLTNHRNIVCYSEYQEIEQIGYNAVNLNMLNYMMPRHKKFKQEYVKGTEYRDEIINCGELTKMADIRFKYGYFTCHKTQLIVLSVVKDFTDNQLRIHNTKFALYIIFLFFIFAFLWRKMVNNMKLDIIKALGVFNILPTLHLASSPEFISEINRSSLTN